MSGATRRALLVLILGIAGFLRLDRLGSVPPGLYRDEAMDGSNALEVLETGRVHPFYPEDNGREGLYVNVAAVFVRFLGHEAWVLRLPAAIFGILTVWGVYLLGAELESAPVGLLAAFFLATSFWHVLLSREAFRAIGGPLFLVWGLYLLMAGLRDRLPGGCESTGGQADPEGTPPAPPFEAHGSGWWRMRIVTPSNHGFRWRHLGMAILAGAVYGLGFYTYLAYRATPLLIGAVLLRAERRMAAAFAASAVVVAAPLIADFAEHSGTFWGRTSQVSVLQSPHPAGEIVLNLWRTGRMFFTRGDANWRHNYAWRAEVFWPVAILLVLGAVLAVRSRGRGLVAVGWLAVAALPVVLSGEGVPHALRAVLMAPAVFLLAAIGGHGAYAWLARKLPRGFAAAAAGALLLALCYEPYHTYFDRWAADPHLPEFFDARARRIAGQIRSRPAAAEKYVAVPPADPMEGQPVMFLTGSYTPKEQRETHIHYVLAPCREVMDSHPGADVFCLQ